MSAHVGYCCINLTLQKKKIFTSRGMILRTFNQRGVEYASELALQNVKDLYSILNWNVHNNVNVFRIGSDMFPWQSKYKIVDLPKYSRIAGWLADCGTLIKNNGMRVSMHPDHFVKLASENDQVAVNSIQELNYHDEIFNMMGLPANHRYCLNIHVGQNAKQIDKTVLRFLKRFEQLNDTTKARLVVENDDKFAMFSVKQLYNYLYKTANIPVTFDYFHHKFHTDNLSEEEAFNMAYSTWGKNVPLFHYSESKALNESVDCNPRAHADYVFNKINDYGRTLDIDLEAKAKELALFNYRSL
jgi:UV DNA damage endonuclease